MANNALIDPIVFLLAGFYIRQGTNGDKAKQEVRASELMGVTKALIAVNGGDASGMSKLQQALQGVTGDPSEVLALNSVLAFGATKLEALSGGLLSTVNEAILGNIFNDVVKTCQSYITAAAPPA